MKINILRKMEYDKHWIHIFQFSNVFQYLVSDKQGNLYQHYINLPANFFRNILFFLGLKPTQYTSHEMVIGEEIVLSGAMETIDALNKKKETMNDIAKVAVQKSKDDCTWRAVVSEAGDLSWQCLNHPESEIIKAIKDQKPQHETE